MDFASIVLALLIGLLAGGAVATVLLSKLHGVALAHRESETSAVLAELNGQKIEVARLQERAERLDQLEADLAARDEHVGNLQEEITHFREERRALETQLAERNKALEEQRAMLDESREKLKESFEALSSEALRKNNQSFLDLAKEALLGQQNESKSELEKRKQAIEEMVRPLKETLTEVTKQVSELEQKRASAYATMGEQVRSLMESQTTLQKETRNLVQALRAPNQRGRWGEMQLRRVVELAGMLDKVDFDEQVSKDTEEGRQRPDMIVRLPNENTIVVDAKTPLIAYLDALECQDEDQKRALLADHARHVRRHIEQLSNKNYSKDFKQSVELVVMFIPSEPVLSAAIEQDSSLIEFGAEKKVLLATPTTLIGLLRAVAFGWRQEALARDAHKIAEAGAELYNRLTKMSDHFARVGKNLDTAVGAYNDMVGSLETRVLPKAREIKELQQSTHLAVIEELKPLDKKTRAIQAPEMAALPFLDDL